MALSTLSAAIARLSKLGYISSTPAENDRRRRELRLTPSGAEAIRSTSVLDAERVRAMLGKLKPKEKNGTVNYELAEDVPGERMAPRILDTDLDYSGEWTYVFAQENGGARVTITEDGEVSNALFRFMSRYIFSHTATLDAYLSSLARRCGENSTPQ